VSEQVVVELFDSPELHVKFVPAPEASRDLFVTFTSRNGGKANKKGFGEAYFVKRGYSALHFVAQRNHWWQVEDMAAGIAAAKHVLESHDRRITYGASMGAHGALVHSKAIGADRVLALSPQFAINNRKAPWMAAWAQDTANVSELFQMEYGLSRTAEIFVVYDPLDTFDIQHAREIRNVREVKELYLGFAGHSTAMALANVRQLSPLVLSMASDQPAMGIVAGYRAGRRRDLGAYMRAQSVTQKAGKAVLSYGIGRQAQALADEALNGGEPQPLADMLQATQMSGKYLSSEQRLARAEGLVALHPEDSEAHMTHARALREAGRLDDALQACSRARKFARRNYNVLLYRALIRAELGDITGAEEEIQVCLDARAPARAKNWLAQLTLYRRAGISEATIERIQEFVDGLGRSTKPGAEGAPPPG
jgi:tetratricopeptide (TPR) repeat protein